MFKIIFYVNLWVFNAVSNFFNVNETGYSIRVGLKLLLANEQRIGDKIINHPLKGPYLKLEPVFTSKTANNLIGYKGSLKNFIEAKKKIKKL